MNFGPQRVAEGRRGQKKRRVELEACLAQAGFGSGPRLVLGSTASIDYLERVIRTLSEMGLVFTCFGQYLSTRYDQIPASDCLLLRKAGMGLRPGLDPTPALHAALGPEPWEGIRDLEETPERYGRPMRRYQTVLADGLSVNLALPDPDFFAAWQRDLALLDVLALTLLQLWPFLRFDELSEAFAHDLFLETDSETRLKWLTNRQDHKKQRGSDDMEMPVLDKPHSSADILVTTHPPVTTLADLLNKPQKPGDEKDQDRTGLVRDICLAWLQRALAGDWFPICPDLDNLAVLGDGGILFRGGATASLSKPQQSKMLGYLMSVAAGNPDDAIAYIQTMLVPGEKSNEQVLKHRFRQVVPFRDGSWGRTDMADSLAEHLFVQWRVANECGYANHGAFQHFCRGLAGIAHLSMRLAPKKDVLREALYEFRLRNGLDELRQGLELKNLTQQAETFFNTFSELPRKLEALRERRPQPTFTPEKSEEPRGATLFSLLLVLVSLGVFSEHFSHSSWQRWSDPLGAILFLLFGGLLLRLLTRPRGL